MHVRMSNSRTCNYADLTSSQTSRRSLGLYGSLCARIHRDASVLRVCIYLFIFFPPVRVCLHVFNEACLRFQVEQKKTYTACHSRALSSRLASIKSLLCQTWPVKAQSPVLLTLPEPASQLIIDPFKSSLHFQSVHAFEIVLASSGSGEHGKTCSVELYTPCAIYLLGLL